MKELEQKIKWLSDNYKKQLNDKIIERQMEMGMDDKSHYMLYNLLGITNEVGEQIDLYQNLGRFLYKYAGSFAEEAIIECFKHKFPDTGTKIKIPNTISTNPKTVEIDCLVENLAIEIKWRDATTDGDHIKKEHIRVHVIKNAGYTPIRIMLYTPNRSQAIRIQEKLKNIYEELHGGYYAGQDAWDFIKEYTEVDLKAMLEKININE